MQDKREISAIVNKKISDLVPDFLNFNALKSILTRGSKMPKKAGCTGSNKVSDCCNYI